LISSCRVRVRVRVRARVRVRVRVRIRVRVRVRVRLRARVGQGPQNHDNRHFEAKEEVTIIVVTARKIRPQGFHMY